MSKILRLKDFFYEKLFKINDTPQRIALGLGLGVSLGILPGTGPFAALFLAVIFKVNRASALLGSLLTNTWLSFITFLLALRIGSAIFRVSWVALKNNWNVLLADFHWNYLFKASFFEIIMPVLVGYILIALSLGIFVYLVSLIVIRKIRHPA